MNKFLKTAAVAAVASFAISGSANAALSAFGFEGGLPAPRAPDSVLYDFDTLGDLSMLDAGYVNTISHAAGSDGSGAQDPFSNPAGTPYLSVLAGGSATITFDKLMKSISFDWGSIDTYNTLTITLADGFQHVIIGNPGGGDQSSALTNGRYYAVWDGSNAIKSVTFASSANSFEVDALSGSAVPEPATWAMMITGFGLAGAAIRRRRNILAVA